MSRHGQIATGIALLALALGWVWARSYRREALGDLREAERQAREVRDIVAEREVREDVSEDPESSRTVARMGGMVQEAARRARLPGEAIKEIKALDERRVAAGDYAAYYRIRIAEVQVEPLVRFVHALTADGHLTPLDIEMTREDRETTLWRASILTGWNP